MKSGKNNQSAPKLPAEMIFNVQLPMKQGIIESQQFVAMTIKQTDKTDSIAQKLHDVIKSYWKEQQVTQEDMDFMVNQIYVKRAETFKQFDEEAKRIK